MNENVNTSVNQDDLFHFIDTDTIQSEKIIAPRYSYWRSVFRVFFRKKTNIVLIAFFLLIILSAYLLPMIWPYDPMEFVTNAPSFNLNPTKAMQFHNSHSLKWLLGSGPTGNSIFYGVFASSRISITLAVVCATINMIIGIILGAIWGYLNAVFIDNVGAAACIAECAVVDVEVEHGLLAELHLVWVT